MAIIKFLIGFPLWWLVKMPRLWRKTASRLLVWLEDSLAVSLHFRLLFIPLFQDESLVGRGLSLIFRAGRTIIGLFVLGIIAIEAGGAFFIWWLTPPWLFINSQPVGFFFTIFLFIYYCYFTFSRPKEFIGQESSIFPLKDYCPPVFFYFFTKARGDYLLLFDFFAKTEAVRRFFERTGTTFEQWREEIKKLGQNRFIEEKFLETAYQKAKLTNDIAIYPDYFFYALCEEVFSREKTAPFLLKPEEVFGTLDWVIAERKTKRSVYFWDPDYKLKILPGVNRSWIARPTPFLDRISVDLTKLAQKGKLPATLVGKKKQVEQVVQVLSRTTKDNVLLLGEAGCGKTTLVYGLAERIIFGGAVEALRGRRIVALDQNAFLAGALTSGEIAKRIGMILDQIKKAGNVILFIDELHNLNPEILLQLEPHLSSTEFQFLGATSYENYHKYLEPYEAFVRLFQIVEVPEATREETMEILETLVWPIERKQRVFFTYQALKAAVDLSDRYIHDRVLPDKAADVIDEAAVVVVLGGRRYITAEDVAGIVAEKTHVLIKQITTDDAKRLLGLEEKLHERLIGQDEAVVAVADALRRARVGLRPGNRPIGALLFVGPTGVGKTELAKALAEAYFGSEKTMVRLDMSEYQTIESINNLIGSPPRGEETTIGGYFTEEIRRRPFSLILLDELEKAHPKILDLFLQVFDDARLTDSLGHMVDFRETIIIATSNVGGNLLEKGLREGKSMEELKKGLEEALHEVFRPEFLNRFDGIVVYRPLSYFEIEKIVDLKIKDLENRLKKQDIKIKISPDFRRTLARVGYRPEMGARPLGRIIADNIEAPLAKEILAGKILPGSIVELTGEFLKQEKG